MLKSLLFIVTSPTIAENKETHGPLKLSITAQPSTDLAISCSTNLTGDTVSNTSSTPVPCPSLGAEPPTFQNVDITLRPVIKNKRAALIKRSNEIAAKLAAAGVHPTMQPPAAPPLYTPSASTANPVTLPNTSASTSVPRPTRS